MTTSDDNLALIVEALGAFQRAVKPLPKRADAGDYRYAPIEDILKHIKKPLKDHGLVVIQTVTGDIGVTTRVCFEDAWIEDTAIVTIKGTMEDRGAAITQLRRYSLITMLGLPTVDAPKEQSEVEKLLTGYNAAQQVVIVKRGLWHLGYSDDRPADPNIETRTL